jgi:hypothetical protein
LNANGLVALTGGKNDPVRRESLRLSTIPLVKIPCAAIDHICGRVDSRWKLKETIRWPETDAPLKWLSDHFGTAVVLKL